MNALSHLGILLALISLSVLPAVEEIVKQPSGNAGKTGTYQVKTEFPGNNYYVMVPSTYSEDNPAGLHVYFHGQNGQKGASHFGTWNKHFAERFNLICINMQYMDGDNMKDLATKVLAARHAVAQVIADYKILVGRGVICCFSGGGVPSGVYYTESAAERGPQWPFNHMALYSSNSRMGINQKQPMSWAISVGEKEWSLAALGQTQGARYGDVVRQIERHPDIFFNIIKGGGHSIHNEAVVRSAEIFRRQDIATSPLLYAPDFAEKDLRKLVFACNKLAFGPARKLIDKLRKKGRLEEPLLQKVQLIEEAISKRVDEMVSLINELAEKDLALCYYYASLIRQYLDDYDDEIEDQLKEKIKNLDRKAVSRALTIQGYLSKNYSSMLISPGTPNLANDFIKPLTEFTEILPQSSQLHQQMQEFLQYKE